MHSDLQKEPRHRDCLAPARRFAGHRPGAGQRVLALFIALSIGACSSSEDETRTGGDGGDFGLETDAGVDGGELEDASADLARETGADRLETLLAQLRSDLPGTLHRVGNGEGWPAQVGGSWLVVATDPEFNKVAGEHDDWIGTEMTPDLGFSWALLPLRAGARYKLTDGQTFVADPWSRAYEWDEFGQMSRIPPTESHLERFFVQESDGFPARTVRVWVPQRPATHLLYAHDGQNLFSPMAPWGGWRLHEFIASSTMVVGIDNSALRFEEYTPVPDSIDGTELGGRGPAYAALVEDTIVPLVVARYGEPDVVGILGSSLGGLAALSAVLDFPARYDFAASLSGTVGWGSREQNNTTLIERFGTAAKLSTKIYLDTGGNGTCVDSDNDGIRDDDPDGADNYCENLQLREVLLGAGYVEGTDFWHWWEPDAGHNEAAWAARVPRAIEIFEGL